MYNMTTEKTFQANIVKKLRAHDCLVYKFESPGQRGVPDLLVFAPHGRTFLIEVKSPSGRGVLSAAQKRVIGELRDKNVEVHVMSSKDQLSELIETLRYSK